MPATRAWPYHCVAWPALAALAVRDGAALPAAATRARAPRRHGLALTPPRSPPPPFLAGGGGAEWVDGGRACSLWLRESDGALHKFDGFKLADFDRVSAALARAAAPVVLVKRELAAAGRNWGTWALRGKTLEWRADGDGGGDGGELVAAVPLSAVSQAAAPGKGEVQIAFMDEVRAARARTAARARVRA